MINFEETLKNDLDKLNENLRLIISKTELVHSGIVLYDLPSQIKSSEELGMMGRMLLNSGKQFEKTFSAKYGEVNGDNIDSFIADYERKNRPLVKLMRDYRILVADYKMKLSRVMDAQSAAHDFVLKTVDEDVIRQEKSKSTTKKKGSYGRRTKH
ncbi:hypothetical protein VCHA53O466_40300 [Vibrio chagasii]|nr:hypothetical protein VCHA53O466_40300 [Vibrio chagasii]